MSDATTITTAGGGTLDLLDPRPEDVRIEAIAAGLGHTCRFAGQADRFYSVAEHCCLGAGRLARQGATPLNQLQFLLHDAHEAYTGDITTPMKVLLGGRHVRRIQAQLQRVILAGLVIPLPDEDAELLIEDVDAVMAATEYVALFGPDAPPWNGRAAPDPDVRLWCWPPMHAPLRWLAVYERLRAEASAAVPTVAAGGPAAGVAHA